MYSLGSSLGERTEFIILSLWTSLEAISAFAEADIEQAIFYPEDDEYLVDRETRVAHYEVIGA